MAAPSFTVLYPEPLPADTTVAREAAEREFPPGTNIVRKTFDDLHDVEKSLADTVDVLMIYKLHVTAEHVERFPNLKVVVRLGVGIERVDIEAVENHGGTAHNTPEYGSPAVASQAVTMACGLAHGLFAYHDELRGTGQIAWDPTDTAKSRAPWDLTFGVLGRGRIGLQAAKIAVAFGFKVIYYDIKTFSPVAGMTAVSSLNELLLLSDVLSLHVPDTKATRNIIGAAEIARLSKGAIIVNTARGRVLDLDAVSVALKSGQLSGVGLDVLPIEPPTDENMPELLRAYRAREKWLAGKVIVTPHSASHSPTSFKNIHIMSAKTAAAVLRGEKNTFRVRPGGY